MRRIFLLLSFIISLSAFSQVTISKEDYEKLSPETKTQIEKITTEKAIKGDIKEMSEYANLGREIGVAVNETLKAVEGSAIRIAESNLGKTAITIVVWKLLYKEIAGLVIGFALLVLSIYFLLTGRNKLSKEESSAGGIASVIAAVVLFISSMICVFGWGAIQAIGWCLLAIFCVIMLILMFM